MADIAIGIDLGGTKTEVAALDGEGRFLIRRRVPTPKNDYDGTVLAVAELIRGVEAELGVEAPVGVGHPGSASPVSGRLRNANSVWLNGRPLGVDLEAALKRPVPLANDADCLALSEAMDGAGAGRRSVFGIIIGTGTGGGIVIDGQRVVGANGIAGEWGHNALPWPDEDEWPGPPCWCGKRGCVETWLSGPSLAREGSAAFGEPIDAAELKARADDGDALARSVIDRYATRLAKATATVINLFDPAIVVLGGGLSNLDDLYTLVPPRWRDWVFADSITTELAPALHGDSSGVRGAAWLGRKAALTRNAAG